MKQIFILILVLFMSGFMRSDQDPLVVNSKTIALKLENPRVRVLEATIKPGDKEKTHSHPAYVIYRDPVTHWAENIGDTTIRLVLVELKN